MLLGHRYRGIRNATPAILLLLTTCVSISIPVCSQNYPVSSVVFIQPPYSVYLNDYASDKLRVNLLLKDLNLPEFQCKLRLTIEGVGVTVRTRQSYIPRPITFPSGGTPLLLTGDDLAEYLNPANLEFQGLSRSQYERGARLPDGVYRFSIEVLEYNRGTVVSNKGTAMLWAVLNDPPILMLPRNNEKIRITDPANIVFTWTPRHTGSPNSAFTAEYNFRMVELWDDRNPFNALQSQPPLYEVTTTFPQIVYGAAEPALIPGRRYAWMVQVRDANGLDLFKNQGQTEVFVFQFGDLLGVPENLHLQSTGTTAMTVRWEQSLMGAEPVNYLVRYRPLKSRSHEAWYETTSTDQWKSIAYLQPDTEYEVQVRAQQTGQISDFHPVRVFKTKPQGADQFVCKDNVPLPPIPDATQHPFRLSINDTIRAGGYDILVREVNPGRGGNTYTGRGVAIIPYFNSARVFVTFEDITVNQQFWYTGVGKIRTVWNANSDFLYKVEKPLTPGDTSRTGESIPWAGEVPVIISETDSLILIEGAAIVSVTKDSDGNIVVETSDGSKQTLEKGTSYSVADQTGNGYVIDRQGNISKTTATDAIAAAGRGNRNYNIALKFEKGEGKYGFDSKTHDVLAHNYQELEGGQYVAWKSLPAGHTDNVKAVLDGAGFETDKIRFELGTTPVTPFTVTDDELTVSLTGKGDGFPEELIAYYDSGNAPDNATAQVIGKLNVVSYHTIRRKLVVVPVNGNRYPYQHTLQAKLNDIFKQAVAEWTVEEGQNLEVPLGDTFDDGSSGMFSNYTADMKKVINAYLKDNSLTPETFYLFVVSNPKSKTKAGYMPRKKQAGFIFIDKLGSEDNAVKTIAHELAHGAFRLAHTFSEYPALPQGSTDNLMDYGTGARLYKYQWDLVHNPEAVLGLFEGDEEGGMEYDCPKWFSGECDEVGKVLDLIKQLSTNGGTLKVSSPKSSDRYELIAENIKLDDLKFSKIKILNMVPAGQEVILNPRNYESYNEQSFNSEGKTDFQTGFVYRSGQPTQLPGGLISAPAPTMVKILLYESTDILDAKIEALKKYLYGDIPTAIIAEINEAFKATVLTPSEIQNIREQIFKVESEEKRKEFYRTLQQKIEYQNQRDNQSIATDEDVENNSWLTEGGKIGDIMCNMSSFAACLEYLGKFKPCNGCPADCDSNTLFPDYLECVHRNKIRQLGNEDYHRGTPLSRKLLGEYFNVGQGINTQISTVNEAKEFLLNKIESGYSVMASISGHLIRIQDVDDNYITVDDPYGQLDMERKLNGYNPYRCKDCDPAIDNRNSSDTIIGNDNKWKIEDAIKIIVRYEWYYNE